jgi:hypothetical protein
MIKYKLLNRLSKSQSPAGDPVSYERAHAVGLITLYNADESDAIIHELKLQGKDPHWVCFVEHPIKNQNYPENSFSAKDISMTGKILNGHLKKFLQQKFDYLICLMSLRYFNNAW